MAPHRYPRVPLSRAWPRLPAPSCPKETGPLPPPSRPLLDTPQRRGLEVASIESCGVLRQGHRRIGDTGASRCTCPKVRYSLRYQRMYNLKLLARAQAPTSSSSLSIRGRSHRAAPLDLCCSLVLNSLVLNAPRGTSRPRSWRVRRRKICHEARLIIETAHVEKHTPAEAPPVSLVQRPVKAWATLHL
jgi:hypothetical protein